MVLVKCLVKRLNDQESPCEGHRRVQALSLVLTPGWGPTGHTVLVGSQNKSMGSKSFCSQKEEVGVHSIPRMDVSTD